MEFASCQYNNMSTRRGGNGNDGPQFTVWISFSKLLASLMLSYFTKSPSGAGRHTLLKLFDIPSGSSSTSEAMTCFICGHRRLTVTRHWMICIFLKQK